jgi:hypothetical protein
MKERGFDYLKGITAIDYGDRLEVLYLLYSTASKELETLIVKLPTGLPPQPMSGMPVTSQKPQEQQKPTAAQRLEVGTVTHVYPAADWFERELSEMFGIAIAGRKAPRLLLEKWNGADAPLRKGFMWGKPYRKLGD